MGEVDDTRSPLPGASIPNVTLSQPCPVCFYFWNWGMWGGGGSLISREKTLTSAQLKYFCAVCMLRKQWRTTALLWLAIMQTLVKNPVGGASQNKKIRDRVDSGVENGKWKLRVMGSWWCRDLFVAICLKRITKSFCCLARHSGCLWVFYIKWNDRK